jgi:thioredoxin-like negative regulator of GroEL
MKRLYYYSAAWCGPCQSFGPVMDQLSSIIPVVKVNVDYEADLAARANVRSVPTVILVEGETEIRRFTGARSYQQVIDFING